MKLPRATRFGHAQAGQRAAILYSLVESCRRRGLDAFSYLRAVLGRLPSLTNWQVAAWTPVGWAHAGCPKAA